MKTFCACDDAIRPTQRTPVARKLLKVLTRGFFFGRRRGGGFDRWFGSFAWSSRCRRFRSRRCFGGRCCFSFRSGLRFSGSFRFSGVGFLGGGLRILVLFNEAAHGIGRLGAFADPIVDAIQLEGAVHTALLWIVGADEARYEQ